VEGGGVSAVIERALSTAITRPESRPNLRLLPIIGDGMEPTLKRGDFALVTPVDDYDGEGMYALLHPGVGGEPAIYRVAYIGRSMFELMSDNPRYQRHEVSSKWFRSAVKAKVVAGVNVFDRRGLGI
jgi:phage repressor protein C with HTH and peptisase S24 domain